LRLVASALRLRRLRDLVVRDELRPSLVGSDLCEGRREGGLPMINVPDGADVHVRFAAIEFFFSHVVYVLLSSTAGRPPSLRSAELRRDSLRSLACLDEARWRSQRAKSGADDQDRTGDLVLTTDALCQLSSIGLRASRYGGQARLRSQAPDSLPLACPP